MKKQFLLVMAVLTMSLAATQAQNFQRQTPEGRTKAAMEKMLALQLREEQSPKVNAVLLELFINQQKAMTEMRASGSMDKNTIVAKRKELNAVAEAKMQAILTEVQFKKWKEVMDNGAASTQKKN